MTGKSTTVESERAREQISRIENSKPKIPNAELREFIIGVEALLGMDGTFRDGFVSHGLPSSCPYTDKQLGYGVNGDGDLGAARDMYAAWHAIGAWNRGICAAFYMAPEDELKALKCRVQLSDRVVSLAKSHKAYAGVFVALELAGKNLSLRAAESEVEAAHVAWELELEKAEAASDVRWKTGVL